MFAGMALSIRLLVYAGLSLFIISGPYLYMVVCVLYAYNLTYQRNLSSSLFLVVDVNNLVSSLPILRSHDLPRLLYTTEGSFQYRIL